MTVGDSSSTQQAEVLAAHGISKSFPGVHALDNVEISVRAGELTALLGENGAGKSTLMNILAGVFPPDDGTITLAGEQVKFRSPREAQAAGISIIFQELNLIGGLSVAENIFLGREPLTHFGTIDFRKMLRDAEQVLAQLEFAVDPRVPVEQLRVGEQQIVEIAKTVSCDSRIVIMDEPTSALTDQEVEVLFRQIQRLKARGVGIVYITHKLDELSKIADSVTVLRDGKFIGMKRFVDAPHDEIIRMMVGRDLRNLFPKSEVSIGEEVLRVRGMWLRHPERSDDCVVEDVSFEVRRGEVLGLFGLMGAGRTELLQTLFGLHPNSSSGKVWVDHQAVTIRSPQQAIQAGLALAPEDRKDEGLVLSMSVAENASLSCLHKVEQHGFLRTSSQRELVGEYVERLRIKTPSLNQLVRNLSGGNQQKVVLAKWLATDPKVLMLDEPTRGIDINAKQEIYTLIDQLAQSGLGVILVSSELPEILAMADRILVLAEGKLSREFSRGEANEETLLKVALPKATM